MRMHTALHALSAVVSREIGALVTGNQVRPDISRVDFSLEALDRDLIRRLVDRTNSLLAEGRSVRISWMPPVSISRLRR
jgi:Ser-tRNA(Ala) deacylase AlaX